MIYGAGVQRRRAGNSVQLGGRRVIHFPRGRGAGRAGAGSLGQPHAPRSFIYGGLSAAARGDKVYEKRRRLRPAARPALLSHTD